MTFLVYAVCAAGGLFGLAVMLLGAFRSLDAVLPDERRQKRCRIVAIVMGAATVCIALAAGGSVWLSATYGLSPEWARVADAVVIVAALTGVLTIVVYRDIFYRSERERRPLSVKS